MTRAFLRVALPPVLFAIVVFTPAKPAQAQTTNPVDATSCSETRFCGDSCSNTPFAPTLCWTTRYGPARANVIRVPPNKNATQSTNMLYCANGHYALCFFSGPPTPTGKPGADNKPLPCVVEEGGQTALCTCRAYSTGPYFVDLHAIENLGAYYETLDACGPEGADCKNIVTCGTDGSSYACLYQKEAPVCKYVAGQNALEPQTSLIPGADIISTFSFAMNDDYLLGSTDCGKAPYAGCMTAPCNFLPNQERPKGPLKGEPIECRCPIWEGPFQIGQTMSPDQCAIPKGSKGESFVWSAAYTVPYEKP